MFNDLNDCNISKLWIRLFQTYKIELIGNHITLNGVNYFFDESNVVSNHLKQDEKPFLCYNEYGQCHIEQNGKRKVFFDTKSIQKISFTAINVFGKKTEYDKYYNTLWFFER